MGRGFQAEVLPEVHQESCIGFECGEKSGVIRVPGKGQNGKHRREEPATNLSDQLLYLHSQNFYFGPILISVPFKINATEMANIKDKKF